MGVKRETEKIHITMEKGVFDRVVIEAIRDSRSFSLQVEHILKEYWKEVENVRS